MNEELKLLLALEVQSLGASALGEIESGLRSIVSAGGGLSAADAQLLHLGETVTAVGAAFSVASLAVTAAMGAMVKAAADWQTTTTQIANNTNMTNAQMAQMQATVQRLAATTSAPLDQLAQGYMHIANFGYDAAQATQILDAAQKSAVATGSDVAETANILANVMHEFNINAGDATQTMDQLHTAAALGNMTLQQFDESFGQAAAYAANIGVPLDQTAAAFAALTRHGLDAAEAGTQIRNLLIHILDPSKQARAEIALLAQTTGVDLSGDFSQAGLQTKGLTGVLTDLAQATNGNADAFAILTGQTPQTADGLALVQAAANGNANALAQLVPNQRGLLGAMILTGTGATDYANILKQVDAATQGAGITNTTYERTQETLAFQMGELRNNIQLMAIAIGTALLPAINQIVAAIVPVVQGIAQWITAHQQLAATFLVATAAILGIVGVLTTLAGIVLMVTAVWGPFIAGLETSLAVIPAVAAAIGGLSDLLPALASGALADSLALDGIGASALVVAPEILIVVAALAALGVAYETNLLGFRDAVDSVTASVRDDVSIMVESIGLLIAAIQSIPQSISLNLGFNLPSLPSLPSVPDWIKQGTANAAANFIPGAGVLLAGHNVIQSLGTAEGHTTGTPNPQTAAEAPDFMSHVIGASQQAQAVQHAQALNQAADAAKAAADAQAQLKAQTDAINALGGDTALVNSLVAMDPAAQAAQAQVDGLQQKVNSLKDAQTAAATATDNARAALQRMQDQSSQLSQALAQAKQRLSDLTHPTLIGETAADNQIFALQQQLERLQLQKDQFSLSAPTTGPASRRPNPQLTAIDAEIARAQTQLDIAQKQKDVRFAPQERSVAQAAAGPVHEVTAADAIKQIADTKAQIADLTAQYQASQTAIDNQKQAVADDEQAQKNLSQTLQSAQTDLSNAKDAHQKITDVLKDEFDWTTKQRPALDALGDAYSSVIETVDAKSRLLVAATANYIGQQNQQTLDALLKAQQAFDDAKNKELASLGALQAAGITPAQVQSVANRPATKPGGLGFASGGSFDVGGFGGTDSQYVAFRATPGEHVTVGTPGSGNGGGAGPTYVSINVPIPQVVFNGVSDARAAASLFAGELARALDSVVPTQTRSPNVTKKYWPGNPG